ncbi:transcriptional regulator [Pectobacterium aroidearum]|uniref:transcriptional regulator n=1 Tax=Pectobacterium aroidearum TaxID=1201031 RepID=UPI0039F17DFB
MTAAIKEACRIAGGQAALARFLGVSPPTINQWVMGVRPVPAERCPSIEKATNSTVTCESLRPDVDWAYLRGAEPKTNESAA